jgi:hypothetical protein
VREILNAQVGLSIGVVAFSQAQQSAIESALNALAAETGSMRISFHLLYNPVCERRDADLSARYVVKPGVLCRFTGWKTRPMTASAIRARRPTSPADRDLRALLDLEEEREEDGQFVGLFVKNLENVQGGRQRDPHAETAIMQAATQPCSSSLRCFLLRVAAALRADALRSSAVRPVSGVLPNWVQSISVISMP